MYTVYDYGRMMCDETRMKAFLGALERCVKPGCTVADLGTGTGIFALVAAKLGARHVYAIDPNPAVEVGKALARENGLEDRVTFFRAISTEVELPERVDVIVSDMRGHLPVSESNLSALIDARDRLLARGGMMIPGHDRLMTALVEAPDLYEDLVSAWTSGRFAGLTQEAARKSVLQGVYGDHAAPIDAPQMLTEGTVWANLDYSTLAEPAVHGTVQTTAQRAGVAHGLCVWFESTLAPGISYSTGPAPRSMVYARMFMPLASPVNVEPGDDVVLSIRADPAPSDHTWSWNTVFRRAGREIASHRQSTFLGAPMSKADFFRAAADYAPRRSPRGDAWLAVLRAMNGATTIEAIAAGLHADFPKLFRSLPEALAEVKTLERKLGGDGA